MERGSIPGRRWTSTYLVFAALAFAPAALAETNRYCDNMCGDTQKCQFVCCSITTGAHGVVTNITCNQENCCAHPQDAGLGAGGALTIPGNFLEGVGGKVKDALVAGQVSASGIAVDADARHKTVTLTGTVPSGAQKARAAAIAKKQAKGYRVVDRLTVEKTKE